MFIERFRVLEATAFRITPDKAERSAWTAHALLCICFHGQLLPFRIKPHVRLYRLNEGCRVAHMVTAPPNSGVSTLVHVTITSSFPFLTMLGRM